MRRHLADSNKIDLNDQHLPGLMIIETLKNIMLAISIYLVANAKNTPQRLAFIKKFYEFYGLPWCKPSIEPILTALKKYEHLLYFYYC